MIGLVDRVDLVDLFEDLDTKIEDAIEDFEEIEVAPPIIETVLQIEDNFEGTSGNLMDAELQICYSGEIILDTDNDSIPDFKDNYPTIANNNQSDIDGDGFIGALSLE